MTTSKGAKTAATVVAVVIGLGALAAPSQADKLGKAGGLSYVAKATKIDTAPPAGATDGTTQIRCGRGQAMAGGGAEVAGMPNNSFLAAVGSSAARLWFADGWHFSQPDHKLTVYGICAKKDRIESEQDLESVPAGSGSGVATATCADGHISGGGVRLTGSIQDWWLNSSSPVDDGSDADSLRNNGWQVFVHHRTGSPAASMIADAICRDGKRPLYTDKEREIQPGTVTLKAKCPNGTAVSGGGAYVGGPVMEGHVLATRPYDSKDKGTVPEDGWLAKVQNASASDQTAAAYAVCL